MLPGQVFLEPRREDEPVGVVERSTQFGRRDSALWHDLRHTLGRLGVAVLVGVILLVQIGEAHPQRVAVEDAVEPNLGVPLLEGERHARRNVSPEA
jgi:ABC-type nitrate/sulfonate/bicarbonate transport system permease component